MIFFISPAKGFNSPEDIKNKIDDEVLNNVKMSSPIFIEETSDILNELKKLSTEEIGSIMKVNDDIASLNYTRFQEFPQEIYLHRNNEPISEEGFSMPAIFSYSGLQYKNMNIEDMGIDDINFLNTNFRILSGLYGVLRPLDGINPYRLEMLTKIHIGDSKNLYEFWGDKIFNALIDDIPDSKNADDFTGSKSIIINLASDEYSKCVKKYIKSSNVPYASITFKVNKNGKLKTESTSSKTARGKLLHYVVKNRIEKLDDLLKFNEDGWSFSKEFSSIGKVSDIIFIKE